MPKVLLLVLCGTLARAEDYVEIRRYLDDPAAKVHSRFEVTDGDHGRIEVRRHRVSHDVDWLTTDRRFPDEPRFPGSRAIAVVKAEVERNGSTSLERRVYLSSLPLARREPLALGAGCRRPSGPKPPSIRRRAKNKYSLKVRQKSVAWDTAYLKALSRQSA